MMNQMRNRTDEALHRTLKSRMTLIAGLLLLLSVVPLPYIAAQPNPLSRFPARNLWPSVVSVSFPSFVTAANPDGTKVLHVSASVTISSMHVPVTIDGGCSSGWCGTILQGSPIRFFRIQMYVLRSDGTWYSNWNMLGFDHDYFNPGTYNIVADDQTGVGGVKNGVYAVIIVEAIPQVHYTSTNERTGQTTSSWTGWGAMRVLTTGTGTVP